jgi:dipeptidase D
VSSAGSRDLEAKVNFTKAATKKSGATCFKLKVDGLRGGHSGVNIHEDRQNAIKILAQTLSVLESATNLELVSIEGGNKRNAIPRYAEAEFIVHPDSIKVLRQTHATYSARLKEMFKEAEPNIEITLAEDGIRNLTFTSEDTRAIINLFQAIPSGVLQMSRAIPDLVQTSNNLGVVTSQDDGIEIICMLRSNVDQELLSLTHRVISIFSLISPLTIPTELFTTDEQKITSKQIALEFSQVSPGWKAQADNELVDYFQESHREITGKEAAVKAIHAGLECGVILSYLPKAKCISFGPEIRDAHSPVEKVKISSVETFYKVFENLVEKLAQ